MALEGRALTADDLCTGSDGVGITPGFRQPSCALGSSERRDYSGSV